LIANFGDSSSPSTSESLAAVRAVQPHSPPVERHYRPLAVAPTTTGRPRRPPSTMTAKFDPEKFEDKYANYFTELQRAYKQAFDVMKERFDNELVHAIDQQILNESEPFYEGDGQFRIDLPDDPADRIQGVIVADEKVEQVLEHYVEELERQLRRVFGFDE
jgi:predicted GTPase